MIISFRQRFSVFPDGFCRINRGGVKAHFLLFRKVSGDIRKPKNLRWALEAIVFFILAILRSFSCRLTLAAILVKIDHPLSEIFRSVNSEF